MINKAIKYTVEWFANPARYRDQVTKPTVLNYPITDNCNARCIMCDIWKERSENELTKDQLSELLQDELFTEIEHVGISGGEPSLIKNLDEYVAEIAKLNKIKSISITTHSFLPNRWKETMPKIKEVLKNRSVDFQMHLSLDGIGEVHDNVRRIPGGFRKVMQTYQLFKENDIKVDFQSTISNSNVFSCPSLLEFAKKQEEEIQFRIATEITRLYNQESMQLVSMNKNEKSFFVDFLESNELNDYTKNPKRKLFYKDLAKRLIQKTSRAAPCMFKKEGILLSAHGDLYLCSISDKKLGNAKERSAYDIYFSEETSEIRQNLLKNTCPNCYHDQSGAWNPYTLIKEQVGINKVTDKFQKTTKFVQNLMHI